MIIGVLIMIMDVYRYDVALVKDMGSEMLM